MTEKYKIIRFMGPPKNRKRTVARGLTLQEAQAWCDDPETSSSTATSERARARTRRIGRWFDGYEKE